MRVDRRRAWWGVALAAYVVALLALVLSPSVPGPNRVLSEAIGLAISLGAPPHPTDRAVEIMLNVLMVAPLAAIGSVVWPRPSWRDWTAGAFLVFSAVELAQGLLLPLRDGSFSDIVANTGGCCLGAAFVAVVRGVHDRRASTPG